MLLPCLVIMCDVSYRQTSSQVTGTPASLSESYFIILYIFII